MSIAIAKHIWNRTSDIAFKFEYGEYEFHAGPLEKTKHPSLGIEFPVMRLVRCKNTMTSTYVPTRVDEPREEFIQYFFDDELCAFQEDNGE